MKHIIVFTGLSAIFLIIQSVIPSWVSITIPVPDVSFIVLIYLAFHYGSMYGQISGFVLGLIMDFMTLAPLGFHALLFTIIGHLIGRGKGIVQLDLMVIPMVLTLISIVAKSLIIIIIGYLLGQTSIYSKILSFSYFINSSLTILVSWLFILLLNLIDSILNAKRRIS